MRKKFVLMTLLASMLLALPGCGQQAIPEESSAQVIVDGPDRNPPATPEPSESGEVTVEIEPVTLASPYAKAAYFADFVFERNQKNTLVSPISLDIALGLAAEGASGKTAEELYAYLGGSDYAEQVKAYLAYAESLSARSETSDEESKPLWAAWNDNYSFQYTIANSVWVNENRTLLPDYQAKIRDAFLAEVDSVDFTNDTQSTAERINSWCNEKTRGLIPEIVRANDLTPSLSTILMNSVYFESPWFERWASIEHSFTDITGKKTEGDMLSDMLAVSFENEYATAFAKDYYNGFQFIGILPKAEGDFSISDLDLEGLLASSTREYDVKAIMPKLNFETTAGSDVMLPLLQAQGIRRAFSSQTAEFDKMIEMQDDEVTFISDVIQKCKIELDENGTKAAAVTAFLCRTQAMPKPKPVKEIYLDRPFAFLIYDSTNDKIVFIGKVTEL